MKQVFAAILILILASCGSSNTNPKEAIVERQKEIKKTMALSVDSLYKNAPTDTTGAFWNEVNFNRRQIALQKEYDSLEVELKKY